MIRKLLIFLLVLAVALAGCQSKQETGTTTDTSSQAGPSSVKITEQAGGAPSEPAVEMSSEIASLLNKAESVTSAEYFVGKYVNDRISKYAHVYVKGDKMKQKLELREGEYKAGEFYDTAYIDLSSQKAVVYCEDYERCNEDPNKGWDAKFTDFVTETPFDVLESIKSAEKLNTALWDSKDVMIVEDTAGGKTRRVYIWTYKGLPLRYDIMDASGEKSETRFEYKGMVVNGVKDKDLEHQQITVVY